MPKPRLPTSSSRTESSFLKTPTFTLRTSSPTSTSSKLNSRDTLTSFCAMSQGPTVSISVGSFGARFGLGCPGGLTRSSAAFASNASAARASTIICAPRPSLKTWTSPILSIATPARVFTSFKKSDHDAGSYLKFPLSNTAISDLLTTLRTAPSSSSSAPFRNAIRRWRSAKGVPPSARMCTPNFSTYGAAASAAATSAHGKRYGETWMGW
mmetsp:Transcript_7552/g.18587  ORF Transcript_7552/g.18587 Transcript_7552/m.18587 type:complete len:211 (+) Transcript_7552:1565-2197(+)